MKYAGINQPFNATVEGAPPGLIGTLGVKIDRLDSTTIVPRATTGIIEVDPGIYTKTNLVVPEAGSFLIIWDDGVTEVPEELTIVPIDIHAPPEIATTVVLDFIPPNIANLVTLHVYEAVQSEGPWAEIDSTDLIGTYPEWISQFITHNANSIDNWFSIAWEDTDGDLTPLSQPVIGRASSVVFQIVERITMRDSSISQDVAIQEAEAALQLVFGDNWPDPDRMNPLKYAGLTALALARAYTQQAVRSAKSSQYVSGLVSQRVDVKELQNTIKGLLDEAARDLHLRTSVVAQMASIDVPAGISTIQTDITRLLVFE